MPEERKGDWMQTYTGIQFWPLDPRPEEIYIEDIAHALSMQCRYGGHVNIFYSVAEHSVRLHHIVPMEDKKWGLLHDAAEAYLGDLIRPLKRYSDIGTAYKLIEARLMNAICTRFELSPVEPQSVRAADDIMLVTEARDLMAPHPAPWREDMQPLDYEIHPWVGRMAELSFLRCCKLLEIR